MSQVFEGFKKKSRSHEGVQKKCLGVFRGSEIKGLYLFDDTQLVSKLLVFSAHVSHSSLAGDCASYSLASTANNRHSAPYKY
jgi:hypothetical protein